MGGLAAEWSTGRVVARSGTPEGHIGPEGGESREEEEN